MKQPTIFNKIVLTVKAVLTWLTPLNFTYIITTLKEIWR